MQRIQSPYVETGYQWGHTLDLAAALLEAVAAHRELAEQAKANPDITESESGRIDRDWDEIVKAARSIGRAADQPESIPKRIHRIQQMLGNEV
jgi:TnpA family transposase